MFKNSNEDIKYCQYLFENFYGIGHIPQGGVTRLGYTPVEDAMHDKFVEIGKELDCNSIVDQVGNTFVCNNSNSNYYLIGSHLDSVIGGGRYDGVIGVLAGLMVLKWAKDDGFKVPIRVVGFRCEESSNFGCCTIGSGLITKEITKDNIGHLVGKNGKTIREVFDEYGYTLKPDEITGIREYLEIHIEQGKVLEEYETQIGVVTTIAGPIRYYFYINGMAEHSGATPMEMRCDALCATSEIILELEKIGNREAKYSSVATVGVIENQPNALNVIPGSVKIGVDIRGINKESLARIEHDILKNAQEICDRRNAQFIAEKIGSIPPVDLDLTMREKFVKIADDMGLTNHVMMSGAGHDAMSFAEICPTGLLFVPCYKGISHNKMEFTNIEDICNGARLLYEYIRRENP